MPLNSRSAQEDGRQQEKANMPCGRISEAENKCCVCVKDSELLPQMPFVAGLLVQCGTQNKTETEEQQKLEKRNDAITEQPMPDARDSDTCVPLMLVFFVLCSLFLLRKISPSSGCLPLSFRVPWLLFHMEHTFLSSPPASPLPSPSRNQCRTERRNKTAI